MKIPALTKSCVLASILALAATAANAEHDKDSSSQKKSYESTEYPRTTPQTDYGTSGNRQEPRYHEQRYQERSGTYDGSDTYGGGDLYDHTGNDGTGPRLKGRY